MENAGSPAFLRVWGSATTAQPQQQQQQQQQQTFGGEERLRKVKTNVNPDLGWQGSSTDSGVCTYKRNRGGLNNTACMNVYM